MVGGDTKTAARPAGRLGDGYSPARPASAELLDAMRRAAEAVGRNPGDIELTVARPDVARGDREADPPGRGPRGGAGQLRCRASRPGANAGRRAALRQGDDRALLIPARVADVRRARSSLSWVQRRKASPFEREEAMTTAVDLSNALAGAVDRAAGSLFAVHGRPRLPSTGVHWRAGLIVTASHTVEPDREVTLTAPDGRTLPAQVAGRDPGLDIAVLRAE